MSFDAFAEFRMTGHNVVIKSYKLSTISAYRMSMACLPHLKKSKNASITNSGSFSLAVPACDILPCATAKAALNQMMVSIAHWTLKAPKRPFLYAGLWLVVMHGLFAFGAIVAGAVMWQRVMGTVEVGLFTAAVFLGVLAGLVAAAVNSMTIAAVVHRDG